MALTKINNNTLSAITGLPAGVGGKVLQVVQGFLNTSATISANSFQPTGLTLNITPLASSSNIYLTLSKPALTTRTLCVLNVFFFNK